MANEELKLKAQVQHLMKHFGMTRLQAVAYAEANLF